MDWAVDDTLLPYLKSYAEEESLDAVPAVIELLVAHYPELEGKEDLEEMVKKMLIDIGSAEDEAAAQGRADPPQGLPRQESPTERLAVVFPDASHEVLEFCLKLANGNEEEAAYQLATESLEELDRKRTSHCKKSKVPETQRCRNTASAVEQQKKDQSAKDLAALRASFPDISQDLICYCYTNVCSGSKEAAAQRLAGVGLKNLEQEMKAHQLRREQVLSKYGDEVVVRSGSPSPAPMVLKKKDTSKKDKGPKVRYRDGKIATTTGAKAIAPEKAPEWDGGSKGKVITKGKRGKGMFSVGHID